MRRAVRPLSTAVLAAALLAGCTSSGSSAPAVGETDAGYTIIVGRDGLAFQPDGIDGIDGGTFVVPVGQPVYWRFATSGFNVVSGTVDGGCFPDNQFCSGVDLDAGVVDCSQAPLQPASSRWTYTFTVAGTYSYFSSPQCDGVDGGVGVVTVQ